MQPKIAVLHPLPFRVILRKRKATKKVQCSSTPYPLLGTLASEDKDCAEQTDAISAYTERIARLYHKDDEKAARGANAESAHATNVTCTASIQPVPLQGDALSSTGSPSCPAPSLHWSLPQQGRASTSRSAPVRSLARSSSSSLYALSTTTTTSTRGPSSLPERIDTYRKPSRHVLCGGSSSGAGGGRDVDTCSSAGSVGENSHSRKRRRFQ